MFRIWVTVFILIGQAYLFYRFRNYLRKEKVLPVWFERTLIPLFILFNLPLIFVYFYIWQLTYFPSEILSILTPFFVWHIATLFLFIVLLFINAVKLPFTLSFHILSYHPKIKTKVRIMKESPRYQKFDASRRSFLQKGVIGLSAYSFMGTTVGVIDSSDYDVINTTITIRNLPEQFKGFTIGMMSDIHSSVFMNKQDMDEYVIAMNALKTDLIVVTGDFVNSKTEEVYQFAEAFSNLKSPYGVYGCLGNHDYFAKDVELVAKKVDDCGVKLLRNDSIKIEKEKSFFNLVGVDDIGRNVKPDDYITRALSSAKNDQPKILLCHKPYYFSNAKNLGIDLTLSGHTHGGQIVFGKVDGTPISLAAFASKYIAGLYTLDRSQLYVNKGIGSVGVPFRINCPPELTVITLA